MLGKESKELHWIEIVLWIWKGLNDFKSCDEAFLFYEIGNEFTGLVIKLDHLQTTKKTISL